VSAPDAGGSLGEMREKASRVVALLEQAYGRPEPSPGRDPLDVLIQAVLSQNTSDSNSERAYAGLRARFPAWEAVLAAPEAELARAIKPGGLARMKAARIREMLRRIRQEQGRLDLSILRGMPSDAVRTYLTEFPGVGAKTAACVLLFALNRPVLPVDTHVHRVSRRLGLIGEATGAERAHVSLQALLREEQVLSFHVDMIAHGRRVCRARSPLCNRCTLGVGCLVAPRG